MLESVSFIRIGFAYFFFILFLRSMDENDEVVAIRSRISLSFSRVILGSGLCLGSVAVMICLTQDAKFMLLLVFQLCKSFMRVNPRHCARWIIVSSFLICRPKTRSGLRSGKRYNKNVIVFGSRRGMMSLYSLNQAAIVRALRSWILPLFHDFVRVLSSLLRRSHIELNGKGMLIGRFVVKRFFAYIEKGLGVA
jgi:hypothetical protein